MTVGVVEALEVVHVREEETDRLARGRQLELFLHTLVKRTPVRCAGQSIRADLGAQLLVLLLRLQG